MFSTDVRKTSTENEIKRERDRREERDRDKSEESGLQTVVKNSA